ncbi:MAG: type II toxin-antitoxin system HicA family toxin [Clostridia bacterium]|nr:type II toxin-antitoxin system HicA family toxin [Clostridia bacterium]
MSTIDKLIERFKAFPADFRFDELVRLLAYFGYEENNKGKTSGSRVAFMRAKDGKIIFLHKPHGKPNNPLKGYQLRDIYRALVERGDIDG